MDERVACVFIGVCVCVCVRERESEREKECVKVCLCVYMSNYQSVCVYIAVTFALLFQKQMVQSK